MNVDKISLVVPLLNESAQLKELLDHIKNLSRLPDEIILVDSGSTDSSSEIIAEWISENSWQERIKVIHEEKSYPGKSRNVGVKAAKFDWIAFLDVGVNPDKDWLEQLAKFVDEKKVFGTFGLCQFNSNSIVGKATCALSYGVDQKHIALPGSLFNRAVFKDIGYFDESLRASEDVIWRIKYFETYGRDTSICQAALVHYHSFPNKFFHVLEKWAVYDYFYAKTKHGVKMLSLISFCILIVNLSIFFGIKIFLIVWLLYIIARGIADPIRRSRKLFWFGHSFKSFLLAIPLSVCIDYAKICGFMLLLFKRNE